MILGRICFKNEGHGRDSAGILPAILQSPGRAKSRQDAGATETVASTLETSWTLCHHPKGVAFDAWVRALIGCVAMYGKLFPSSDIAGRLR